MESSFPAGAANGSSAGGGGGSQAQQQAPAIREQDRLMPIANVIRIMRRVLPAHAKISDDAKETIQECVSEYISPITGDANEQCQREQRKIITAEDVPWAMSRLGFDDYVEPLSIYQHRYREFEGEARGIGLGGDAARGGGGGDHHHYYHHPMLKSHAPAAAMAHHHDMHMHATMYGGAVPPHHGFALPPHQGQYMTYPYDTYGGEHAVAAYYGGAYGPGNGGDGSGSSSSHTPQAGGSLEHQHPFAYK